MDILKLIVFNFMALSCHCNTCTCIHWWYWFNCPGARNILCDNYVYVCQWLSYLHFCTVWNKCNFCLLFHLFHHCKSINQSNQSHVQPFFLTWIDLKSLYNQQIITLVWFLVCLFTFGFINTHSLLLKREILYMSLSEIFLLSNEVQG